MTDDLQSRVDRERTSHTDDDVLGNSYKMKAVFAHTVTSKTMRRMHRDYLDRLKDVKGRRILDIGCGHGKLSLSLLERGAEYVAGIDISHKYIGEAKAAARAKGYTDERFAFDVMDAHHLSYPDNSFDAVVGYGILHHLELSTCLSEIERVLKPGGVALFVEPLAGNPMLKLFRRFTPRARTVDERPLDKSDLMRLEDRWCVESRYYGMLSAPVAALTSIVLRPFPGNPFLSLADSIEQWLGRFKIFNPYHQYVMLVLIKRQRAM